MANASRNAGAELDRHRRWGPARDGLWDFLAPRLDDGARVAIVGAGNGDDLPLRRIAARAGEVVLIDIDPRAAQGARRRLRRAERRKVAVVGHDVTRGDADRVALAASRAEEVDAAGSAPIAAAALPSEEIDPARGVMGAVARPPGPRDDPSRLVSGPNLPLPGAPYDLVVGDLLYSQLLYPALLDLGVDPDRRAATLARHAPALTRAAVARIHASAPRVVHIHDPLAWWDGHEQPVALAEILAPAAREDPAAALSLVGRGLGPHESDPRAALADLGITPTATALWRWPFTDDVDYLVCATYAGPRERGLSPLEFGPRPSSLDSHPYLERQVHERSTVT